MSAIELLEKAAGHLRDRAETYDKPSGERSIGATVAAFNAVTGDGLMNSEERGWLFMALLKMVRSQQGNYKADNYEDLAAYSGLMGEAACIERNGGYDDAAIKASAFKTVCDNVEEFNKSAWPTADEWDKAEERQVAVDQNGNDGAVYSEYTLAEVIGDAVLSDWAEWVAVSRDGGVVEHEKKPDVHWIYWVSMSGMVCRINEVVPPLNFRNCIWKIDKTIKPS